jgi:hypothetical protein
MCKRIFPLLALAITLHGSQCWASTCSSSTDSEVVSCTNTFSPTDATGTYEFGNDGRLIVQFDTVLTTFMLTVTVNNTIDPIDFTVFPEGTVCVQYLSGQCEQYDFTGNAGGPHGVPVKNVDYKRLITLTLSYQTPQIAHDPAFGHAPGDSTTFTEDILASYSNFPLCSECDPTMGGKTPGLSSIVALDQPLVGNDTFCFVSPQANQTFQAGREIEVAFQLFSGGPCLNNSGSPIRDKTARLSLSTTDTSGNIVFPRLRNKEEGNKFHFDHKDGVNEFDLSTQGLAPGTYTITVFGSMFSPQSVNIILVPCTGDCDDDKDDD